MPPRFAYWTIIIDGSPTSFRARELADLLPTFHHLKRKSADAVIKWFAGGKLWDSPDHAREARTREVGERQRRLQAAADAEWRKAIDELRTARLARGEKPGAETQAPGTRSQEPEGRPAPEPGAPAAPRAGRKPAAGERRGKDWRPGGEHRDPRDKYKGKPGERRERWKRRFFDKRRSEGAAGLPRDERRPEPGGRDAGGAPGFRGKPRAAFGSGGDRGWKPKGSGFAGRPKAHGGGGDRREDRRGGESGWKPKGPRFGNRPNDQGGSRGRDDNQRGGDRGWKPKGSGFAGRPKGHGGVGDRREVRRGGETGWKPKGPGVGRGPKPFNRGGKPPGRRRD